MKYTYNQALRQICLQCKTKKTNCKKEACKRYASFKACIRKSQALDKLMRDYLEVKMCGDDVCGLRFQAGAWAKKDTVFLQELKNLFSIDDNDDASGSML